VRRGAGADGLAHPRGHRHASEPAIAAPLTGSLTHASPSATGEAKPGGLGRDAEELLRAHLKRRHAASILSLKEEFLRKRKKGKLPKDATSSLKAWWQANLVWPYPSVRAPPVRGGVLHPCVLTKVLLSLQDDDKRALGDDTGLNSTQINNCACVRCRHICRAALSAHPLCHCRVHQPAQAPLAQGAHRHI